MSDVIMSLDELGPLTEAQKRELDALRDMPDSEIDLSDIPEKLDWSHAHRGPLTPEKKREMIAARDARWAMRQAAKEAAE